MSAGDGETISLFVTTPAPSFDVSVYRLGWYDNGARSAELVDRTVNLKGIKQSAPRVDARTGMVSASNWVRNGTLTVSGWRTGLYLLRLEAADGDQNYIPLVVRDDRGNHAVLFEHSANTDQAYNGWGGKSLYTFNSTGDVTDGGTSAAVKVSFDRPYLGSGEGESMLKWELDMVRWLESNGFDVAYVSDIDVHRDPAFASRARAVLQVGHNEYWSKEMRDHLEEAHRLGKGLSFFTGDTGAWAVRFEDSPLGSNRVMVCYRAASLDPIARSDPTRATTHWRDAPLKRPTQAFIGVGTNAAITHSADWVAEDVAGAAELFVGTGFKQGDVVPNLVGYEYDGLWTPGAGQELPSGVKILGRATVIPASPVEAQLQFSARYDLDKSAPSRVGRLSTTVETIQAGPTWTLMVNLVSSARTVYLQYETGSDPVHQYKVGQDYYAVFPLGEDFAEPGWRRLDRDLAADYLTAFGKVPDDLHVAALVTRGSLGLGPLSLTALEGSVMSTAMAVARRGESAGWRTVGGIGTVDVAGTDPSGHAALVFTATIPKDRRPDEADTVAIQGEHEALVVAVGTIQWSWALDSYGTHVDTHGNKTNVDPRIQALTRNIVLKSIASAQK